MAENSKAKIKEKFADVEYPIHVVGRHISVTEPMKAYAVDKLRKTERFGGRMIDAMIIMDIQKKVHSVDYVLNVNDHKIKVSGRSEDMYASIDKAIDRLEAKLTRYMRRLHEHQGSGIESIELAVNVIQAPIPYIDDINDQIEEERLQKIEQDMKPHKVLKKDKQILKTLTQDEAIMKMELSEDHFMLYSSEEDRKLKAIYRTEDGNYGIIEVEK